jgi:arginase
MRRNIAILGAPTSIGIRTYDSGAPRQLDRAPGVLRGLGLVQRLHASDLGDVRPPAYRDYVRPAGRARNEAEVGTYCRMLSERVEEATRDGRFAVVLGGDCSIVLGCLLGARKSAKGSVGLVYVDAHADFGTPEESLTGSVASMCLALAVGRGETPLACLSKDGPLVHGKDVVLIGRRDAAEPWYGHAALAASPILDIPGTVLMDRGGSNVAAAALKRLTSPASSPEMRGFWIHLDADVINPSVMAAVDSPEPGGPTMQELAALLTPLTQHPRALGLELTIYDPGLDPDGSCASRLVSFLENVLREVGSLDGMAA